MKLFIVCLLLALNVLSNKTLKKSNLKKKMKEDPKVS